MLEGVLVEVRLTRGGEVAEIREIIRGGVGEVEEVRGK